MGSITAISNQKGGVGKTTVTINLGKCLASKGDRVLLVDNDSQGSMSKALMGDEMPKVVTGERKGGFFYPGVANVCSLYNEDVEITPYRFSENLWVIGSTRDLAGVAAKPLEEAGFYFKANLAALKDSFDYILIDCPPALGTLQTSAQMAADFILIPTHLDDFSGTGIEDQLKTAKTTRQRYNEKLKILGILANDVAGKQSVVERHFFDEFKEKYGSYIFESYITRSAKIKESHALRMSVAEHAEKSVQAKQFSQLTDEFIGRIGAAA